MPIHARHALTTVVLPMLVLLGSCADEPAPPPTFAAGYETLDRALSERNLNRTGFASRFPKPTARQVVSFLFSPAGSQALLADVSPLGEEIDPVQDVPVWPHGIMLRHSERSEFGLRQVVLTWDDARGVVIGKAYDEGVEPVFSKEWKVGPLKAARPTDPNDGLVYQGF